MGGSVLSPGDGSGDPPLHSDQEVCSAGPTDWFKVARHRALALGGQGGNERKSEGWASDPHSHPEAAQPVPPAGAGPPSQVSATSGRCTADWVFGLRRVPRRTGRRASGAEPDRRCRSQGSPVAAGEGAAWREPGSGQLRALLRSFADPKRCSRRGSELRTWKIDPRCARASHWSQLPAGSGRGLPMGEGAEGGCAASSSQATPPQPNSHCGPTRWGGGILVRHAENLAPPPEYCIGWKAMGRHY